MKLGGSRMAVYFSLTLITLLFFVTSSLALKCYTCDSLTRLDGNKTKFDKTCEHGVASSANLLKTCVDTTSSGKTPFCNILSFKGDPKESNLTLFKRQCYYSSKGKLLKGCASLPASVIFQNTDPKRFSPKLLAELQRSKEPFRNCFCNTDGCNSKDNVWNAISI